MDPAIGTTSPKLRRQVLRQAVRDNVYVIEGRRPPRERGRRWPRFLALLAAVPAAALALLATARSGQMPPALAALVPAGIAVAAPADEADVPAPAPAPPVASVTRGIGSVPPPVVPVVAEPSPIDGAVFPVGVHRIVLDPGHGGRDLGTVTADGTPEKDLALDITRRLAALLRRRGMEVLLTREDDRTVLLKDRARFANEERADLFVSVHLNWLVPATNRGVETFYLGPTQDPFLVQLASRENRESGYALADVRRLLDGIYLDLRQQQSRDLAAAVQRSLYRSLARQNPALRDRGVKSAPFLVLVGTEMPAILAEVSCLSNEKEAALLATDAYRQTIAEALLDGLETYTVNLSRPAVTGG